MEQYIEDREIMTVAMLDTKTPTGNEMVEITFIDGSKEKMPKMRFELIVTSEKSDATKIRSVLTGRIAALCFGTMHEYGVKMGEVNGIVDAITGLVNDGFTKAQDIMWKVDYLGIPLIDINKVLLDARTKEDNSDGTTSERSGVDPENKD